MLEDDCLTIKKLGDSVKPPHGSKWFGERDSIMKSILLAKFSQNGILLRKLQATETYILVEATRDTYWGLVSTSVTDQSKTIHGLAKTSSE